MKYKFMENSVIWVVDEFDERGNCTKETYGTGNIYGYEYDENDKCIRKSKNGEIFWEAKSKLDILIEKLEKYYDKVNYSDFDNGFRLTDENGVRSNVDFIGGKLVVFVYRNKVSYVFPKALQLIEDYYNECN